MHAVRIYRLIILVFISGINSFTPFREIRNKRIVMYSKSNEKFENTDMSAKPVSDSGVITLFLIILNGIVLSEAYTSNKLWYQALMLTIPLLVLNIFIDRKKKNSIQGNFTRWGALNKPESRKKVVKRPSEMQQMEETSF